MAGFGAAMFAAAGAMQGVGNQIIEDAKAKREERLKQLEREFQLKRDDTRYARDVELKKMDQTFQGGESEKSRTFQGGENALNRNQQSSENQRRIDAERDLEEQRAKNRATEGEKDRAIKGEYGTGTDGKTMFLQGGQAKPVTGPDGQPVGSVTRFNSGTVTSPSEKRLRYERGLDAGKPISPVMPHNWNATVAEWRALDVDVQDPKIVERVRQDLESQAGKKGMRGDAAVKWINGEMMRLGVGVNSSTENLKAPGPTAPTRASSESGGGFSAAVRGAPGQTVATPAPSGAETTGRIDGAFSAFPKGDSQAGKVPAPAAPSGADAGGRSAMVATAIEKARAAIAAGAPRDAVIRRLQAAGIDTSGF